MYILYVCKYIYVYIYTHVYVLCMQRHPFWCFYPIHTMPRRMWPSQPQQALRRPSKAVPPGRCWTRQSGMAKWLAGELLSSFPVNLSCELCTTYSWKCLWHNYSWAYSTSWKTLVNGQRMEKEAHWNRKAARILVPKPCDTLPMERTSKMSDETKKSCAMRCPYLTRLHHRWAAGQKIAITDGNNMESHGNNWWSAVEFLSGIPMIHNESDGNEPTNKGDLIRTRYCFNVLINSYIFLSTWSHREKTGVTYQTVATNDIFVAGTTVMRYKQSAGGWLSHMGIIPVVWMCLNNGVYWGNIGDTLGISSWLSGIQPTLCIS